MDIDGPKKRNRRRTSCGAALKAIDSNMQEQPLTKSIKDVDTNDSAGAAFNDQVPDANPSCYIQARKRILFSRESS